MDNSDDSPDISDYNNPYRLGGDVHDAIEELVEQEPRTVTEIHDLIGEDFDLSRSQVDMIASDVAMASSDIRAKKPRERSSRIFFRS